MPNRSCFALAVICVLLAVPAYAAETPGDGSPTSLPASKKVTQAETLLRRADSERDNPELISQLGALGEEIVPLLKDVLACDGQSEHIVAIRALGKMGTRSAAETLRYALSRARDAYEISEAVPALLAISSNDAAMDELARIVAAKPVYTQTHFVRAVQAASIPDAAKMRLYSHFDEFSDDGKDAVIRALSALGTREAFDQLSAIILTKKCNIQLAVPQLAEMSTFDPCPVFVRMFKAGNVTPQLMTRSAIRGCKSAVAYLETVKTTKYEYMETDYPMIAAAALARLGKDVQANTEIVKTALKQAKPGYYVHEAAGMLRDKEIMRILFARMSADGCELSQDIITSLGPTRNPEAANALRESIERSPITVWDCIGTALERLGADLNDAASKSDGKGLRGTIRYIGQDYACSPPRPNDPELAKARENAVAFLRKCPRLFKKLFTEDLWPSMPLGVHHALLGLARQAWTPEATPILEEVIKTDQHKVTYYRVNGGGGPLVEYPVRKELARLLQEKTGKPYTYVDVDGKTKRAGP